MRDILFLTFLVLVALILLDLVAGGGSVFWTLNGWLETLLRHENLLP